MEYSLILLDAPLGLAADFDRCANDLMPVICKSIQPNFLLDGYLPDAARINSCTPATAESVQITAADPTVRDFDINVRLFPSLGLVALPFHFALGGTGVETQPSFKLVRGAHGCVKCQKRWWLGMRQVIVDARWIACVYRANLSNDSIAPTEQIRVGDFIVL